MKNLSISEILGVGPKKVHEILSHVMPDLPEDEKHAIVLDFPNVLERVYRASVEQFRDRNGEMTPNGHRRQFEVIVCICLVDLLARIDAPHVWRVANEVATSILREAEVIGPHVQTADTFIEIYDRLGRPWFTMRRDGSIFLAPSATKEECARLFWEEVKRIAWQYVNIETPSPTGTKPPAVN